MFTLILTETVGIPNLSAYGLGGAIAALVFYFYRQDRVATEKRFEELTKDFRAVVERVRALLQTRYTCRQATYDLRRLKRKGLILRVPRSHRYHLTSLGRRVAVLFTKIYGRVLAPGLSAVDPHLPDDRFVNFVSAKSPSEVLETPAGRS